MLRTKSTIFTSVILKEVPAIIALVLIYFMYVGHLFDGNKSFATSQDNTYMILPIFSYISNSFSLGEYPYWLNTLMGGIPLYNSPQFSTTYPFYFFHSSFYKTPVEAILQVHYVTLTHYALLYVNMYILMRSLKISAVPGLLGATVFSFSPTMLAFTPWVNMAPFVWFPLVITSIILIMQHEHIKAGIILGSISISLLTLASTSHVLIYTVYFSFVLVAYYSALLIMQGKWSRFGQNIISLFFMSTISFMISSPSLLPVLIETDDMIRWIGESPPLIGNDKMPFDAFLLGQSTPAALGNALVPIKGSFLLGNSYIGLICGFLASFSIFQFRKNPVIPPLIFIGFYGLLASTGSHLGIGQINYQIPLLDRIREPGRYLFLFVFCMSILAGFGFDYLIETASKGVRAFLQKRILITSTVYLLLTAFIYVIYRSQQMLLKSQRIPFAGLVVFIGLFLSLSYLVGWKKQIVLLVMMMTAIFINLKQHPWDAPRLEDGDYFAFENLRSHNVLEEVSKIEDINNYRIIFDDGLDKQHWAMNAVYYGLRTFNVYFNPLPYEQFLEMYYHGYQFDNYYELLGAKYILCEVCDSEILKSYRFQKDIFGLSLYVSERAMPRYFIVNQIADSYQDRSDFYSKISNSNDFQNKVYISISDLPLVSEKLKDSADPLSCVSHDELQSVNKLSVSVNCNQNSVFVLNEYYSMNWKAKINGNLTVTYKLNLNQVGLFLNEGANLVELSYQPNLFIGLLWLQKITSISLSAYVIAAYVCIPLLLEKTKREHLGENALFKIRNESM